jgi:outer membrane protein assembly factor BamB
VAVGGSVIVGVFVIVGVNIGVDVKVRGTLKWRYLTGGQVGTPSIDNNGVIYVGSHDGYLYAINPSGFLKWRILLGGNMDNNPVIGPDHTLYITSGGELFAIETEISYWSYLPLVIR